MSFADDIARFAAKTEGKANTIVREVVLGVGTSVVMKSPVGDPENWLYNRGTSDAPDYVHFLAYRDADGYVGGQFRANWQYATGAAPTGAVEKTDAGGSLTIGAMVQDLPADALGKVHYIANNLPYGERLENGWSGQAPNGMVQLTVTEFQSMVNEAVRGVGE